ncbi:MAG: nucleotidyltransferase family protein [Eubacteriales bacterium]
MLNIAVICEYNLFHNGHLRQIEQIKALYPDSTVTAVMSGSFVQRGECAVTDKYTRARSAVLCGADLVLELPMPYSMGSAEYFADAGIRLCMALGVVDKICFGSECGDIALLKSVAENMSNPGFRAALEEERREHRSDSVSFIRMRQSLYDRMYGGERLLANDILGVEYLRAAALCGSSSELFTIKRMGSETATMSRDCIRRGIYSRLCGIVPPQAFAVYKNCELYDIRNIAGHVICTLRNSAPSDIRRCDGVGDGMEYRIIEAARSSVETDGLYRALATKKYTDARMRRTVMNCMLGITTEMLKRPPAFTSILAASENGRGLLRRLKKASGIPILTKPAHGQRLRGESKRQFDFGARCDELYTMMCIVPKKASYFMQRTPYIAENMPADQGEYEAFVRNDEKINSI